MWLHSTSRDQQHVHTLSVSAIHCFVFIVPETIMALSLKFLNFECLEIILEEKLNEMMSVKRTVR